MNYEALDDSGNDGNTGDWSIGYSAGVDGF